LEKSDRVSGREDGFAEEVAIGAGENAKQRRFSRSVQTDHADLRAVEIGEIDVFEDLLLSVKLRDTYHRVDDFVRFGLRHSARIVERVGKLWVPLPSSAPPAKPANVSVAVRDARPLRAAVATKFTRLD